MTAKYLKALRNLSIRTTSTLEVARQLFKHDNIIIFRIYASVYGLPKNLRSRSPIYELKVGTRYPFPLYYNGNYHHDCFTWGSAFHILTERVNKLSRQFGLERIYLYQWEKQQKA